MDNKKACTWMLVCLSLLLPQLAFATAPAGKVIFSLGKVSVERNGAISELRKNGTVEPGDELISGTASTAHIRFTDGSIIALLPKSALQVNEYQFDDTSQEGRAIYTLLSGTIKTLTGKIPKPNYKMQTPIATIGIRGTHYLLSMCETCETDKLVGKVYEGSVSVENVSNQKIFPKGQAFMVSGTTSPIVQIFKLPSRVQKQETLTNPQNEPASESSSEESQDNQSNPEEGTSGNEGAEEDEQSEIDQVSTLAETSGSLVAENTASETVHLKAIEDPVISGSESISEPAPTTSTPIAPTGSTSGETVVSSYTSSSPAAAFIAFNSETDYAQTPAKPVNGDIYAGVNGTSTLGTIGKEDGLVSDTLINASSTGDGCSPCTFDHGTATLVEYGNNASIGVNWGRWNGDYSVTKDGVNETYHTPDLHFIQSQSTVDVSSLTFAQRAALGTLTFNYAGGTSPTDELGNAGVVNSAGLTADFGSMQFTSVLIDATVNGSNFNLTQDPGASMLFADTVGPDKSISLTGSCSSGACGTTLPANGSMSGAFVGSTPSVDGFIGSYSASTPPDGTGDEHTLSGSLLLK